MITIISNLQNKMLGGSKLSKRSHSFFNLDIINKFNLGIC